MALPQRRGTIRKSWTLGPRPLDSRHSTLVQPYRQAIADYIRAQANPPDKFSHQPRLYRLARQIAEAAPFDDDLLYAAAWLHDIGVFIGHRPEDPKALANWDNVAYAVKKAPELLRKFGFPPKKIPGRS